MKKTTFLIVTIALLGNLIVSPAQSAELKVKIDKVKHDKGMVYAQIFQGADNYKNGKPLSSSETIAKAGIMHLTFSNLDVGQYAVRIYHDENGNGKLDTNPFGIPTEAYAFSQQCLKQFWPTFLQGYGDYHFRKR